ncbi:hypothetical protein [Hoeflea sp. IMCC20628]|uniref:hypothetical protein n=1 Tax=Hoeflea sp. IMCC20628 TaxID=1620421 RepID=UPI0012E0B304|nr:hypothetical protein [Hoeflea sp. IMCC20628]
MTRRKLHQQGQTGSPSHRAKLFNDAVAVCANALNLRVSFSFSGYMAKHHWPYSLARDFGDDFDAEGSAITIFPGASAHEFAHSTQ